MKTIKLKDLEERVRKDSEKKDKLIAQFKIEIAKRNCKKRRIRPKDPTEAKMLSSFKEGK